MDWNQTLTIIASMAGILTGYAFLLNKRIKDIRKELTEIRMLLYKVLEVP